MNKNRFAKQMASAAGIFFLCAAPGLTQSQSSPAPSNPPGQSSPPPSPSSAPSPKPTQRKPLPVVRPKKAPSPADDFAGLTLTDEQKAKIDKIHEDMKVRVDAVKKDEKLSPEQRDAFLTGYERMERGQVFAALTPEQQKEVRAKIRARHTAEQEEKKKQQPKLLPVPPPQPK